MYSDPIADMFTRIRNGYMAKKSQVQINHSGLKVEIIKILKDRKYIKNYKITEDNKKKFIVAILSYPNGKPAINKIEKVSKTSRRVYQSKNDLPYVLSGIGEAIVSTSSGVMTVKDARKKGIGGEVICKIW